MREENMADDQTTSSTPVDKSTILQQVESELTKQKRDSLKSKLKALVQKRDEARRAALAVEKEIEDEITKFEEGLA